MDRNYDFNARNISIRQVIPGKKDSNLVILYVIIIDNTQWLQNRNIPLILQYALLKCWYTLKIIPSTSIVG